MFIHNKVKIDNHLLVQELEQPSLATNGNSWSSDFVKGMLPQATSPRSDLYCTGKGTTMLVMDSTSVLLGTRYGFSMAL